MILLVNLLIAMQITIIALTYAKLLNDLKSFQIGNNNR